MYFKEIHIGLGIAAAIAGNYEPCMQSDGVELPS